MPGQNILLDTEIRDWVLLPVVFILVCVGVLRHYASVAMRSKNAQSFNDIREHKTLAYCRMLLANGAFLPKDSFQRRLKKYIGSGGELTQEKTADPLAAMSDPSMMGNMMKNNVMMMVPNILMMNLISMFFSGFVMAKMPFHLPARFKGMIQRGVDIDHLDCAYATSLSLYFLFLFGLQGILSLLLGSNEGDEMRMMQAQLGQGGAGQPGQPVDIPKMYKATAEELKYVEDTHAYALVNARKLLLQGL